MSGLQGGILPVRVIDLEHGKPHRAPEIVSGTATRKGSPCTRWQRSLEKAKAFLQWEG